MATKSSRRFIPHLIHLTGLTFFTSSLLYIPHMTDPLHFGFGSSYQFLTIISLTLSFLTLLIALLADLSLSPSLSKIKTLLSICVTPLEVLVTMFYWGLRAVNKDLVTPKGHELRFLVDLVFHAMPALMLVFDFLMCGPGWEIRPQDAMALDLVLTFCYWGWVEICASRNGW